MVDLADVAEVRHGAGRRPDVSDRVRPRDRKWSLAGIRHLWDGRRYSETRSQAPSGSLGLSWSWRAKCPGSPKSSLANRRLCVPNADVLHRLGVEAEQLKLETV